jgi:hypothetical protein
MMLWARRLGASLFAMVAASVAAQTARVADGYEPAYLNHTFFVVVAVDGRDVPNALDNSLRASFGMGSRLRYVATERTVPADRRVTLKLRGTEANPAPIHGVFRSLFGSGTPDVGGEVQVELKADRRYRVNGLLDGFRREVWLEDADTREVIGAKVSAAADPQLVKAMEGAVYTTTNLRYESDWIGDGPLMTLPFVPVGSRIKVLPFGSSTTRTEVLVEGRKMRVGVDWARKEQTIQQMLARITSAEDPRPKVGAWPQTVREAVASGRVMAGMTREQAMVALGRPRLDLVPALEVGEWPYDGENGETAYVVFDADGRVKEVDASRKTRAALLYVAPPAPTASGASAPAAASAPH